MCVRAVGGDGAAAGAVAAGDDGLVEDARLLLRAHALDPPAQLTCLGCRTNKTDKLDILAQAAA